jgi:hypothetical protein
MPSRGSRARALAGVLAVCCCLLPRAGAVGAAPAREASESPGAALRCEGEQDDPRVAAWRTRAADDGLLRFAAARFGRPTACEGKLGSASDGNAFGRLRFSFVGGSVLEIETAPPETSRVTLTAPGGFGDETAARAALEEYARGVGARIDWSKPTSSAQRRGERVVTFWDPSHGLNAGADLRFRGGKLVAIALHLAP